MKENITVNNSIKSNKSDIFGQIKGFFVKYPKCVPVALYGGMALFILTFFTIALAMYGVYPFGDAMISSYDMSAQIAPFIEHFFDVIEGKTSLFYSYAIAGGADVFGTLAYCCVSPFTFIFLLFGKGNAYYGTAIVLPLKIVCVGCAALYYIRKRFPEIHPVMQFVLALSYAFSGYLYVANTYINWVDLMIYLPFVALGFYRIKTQNKKTTFIVALALMIYTCFSISCFSLLLIFPVIVLYCLFVEDKQNGKKLLANTIWALALAIIVSLPILLPALRAFLVSGRKTDLFENINAKYSEEALYKKASYIFTDSICLFFTLVYFVKYGFKQGINKFLLFSGIIIFIPVVIDESMNLLNFGSYMSYSLRFGFLNGFYLFFIACLLFSESTKEQGVSVVKLVSEKTKALFGALMACLVFVFTAGLIIFYEILKTDKFTGSFGGRFAHSLGGLEVTAIIFAFIALIVLLALFLYENRKINSRILAGVLLALTCAQSVFYGFYLVSGNYGTTTRYDRMKNLTDYVQEIEDDEQVRIKMCGDYLTSCMPLVLHTHSYSVFSSVIDNTNFVAPSILGFNGNGKNQIRSYGGRLIGDAILGNKYLIYEYNSESNYFHPTSYSKFYKKETEHKALVDENGIPLDFGDYELYVNKYALPHAFAVKPQDSLYENEFAAGYDELVTMLSKGASGALPLTYTVTEENGVFKVEVKRNQPGDYYLAVELDDMDQIVYSKNAFDAGKEYTMDDTNTVFLIHSNYSSGYSYLYLKSKGEALTKDQVEKACTPFVIPDQAIELIYNQATAQKVEFSTQPNKITAKLNAEEGEYLFVNYVALVGHTAYVNGKKVEMKQNALNFILVPLEKGENHVEIVYKSPYIKLILIGLAVAIAMVGVYLLIKFKFSKLFGKTQNILIYLGLALAAGLCLFYIVMPTGVCLFKNFKLLVNTVIGFLK